MKVSRFRHRWQEGEGEEEEKSCSWGLLREGRDEKEIEKSDEWNARRLA